MRGGTDVPRMAAWETKSTDWYCCELTLAFNKNVVTRYLIFL